MCKSASGQLTDAQSQTFKSGIYSRNHPVNSFRVLGIGTLSKQFNSSTLWHEPKSWTVIAVQLGIVYFCGINRILFEIKG